MQVVVFIVNPQLKRPVSFIRKDLLKFVVLSQLVPRFLRIYPLYRASTTTSGMLIETAWAGAAINLFFYMLASSQPCEFKFVCSKTYYYNYL